MKQISLHVYQSIDGCPAPSDKHFDAAVDASSCVLIDEETYLRIYMNHLGWPITAKETLVVTNGGIDLTENERVKFIQGDAVAELRLHPQRRVFPRPLRGDRGRRVLFPAEGLR